jgi:hypothetical protein
MVSLTLKPQPKFPTFSPEKVAERKHEARARVARRSRGKGKRAESEVSAYYSEWWGIPEYFYPTKSSGAGVRIGQAGDIGGPANFLLISEVKNDESWNLSQIISYWTPRHKVSAFWTFWQQVCIAVDDYNTRKHARQPEKFPCLIFTKNFDEYLIMLPSHVRFNLNLNLPNSYISLTQDVFKDSFVICNFLDFLNVNEPSTLCAKDLI